MAKPKSYKTTQADVTLFVDTVKKSMDILGVTDYEMQVIAKDTGDNWGECAIDMDGGQGSISISNQFTEKPNKEAIILTAVHEACEALMWPIGQQAEVGVAQALVNTERHRVISRLVPIVRSLL